MNFQQIIADLQSRGEKNIRFTDSGIIISNHGKSTVNYWIVEGKELKCVDCRTIYSYSI